MTGNLVETSEPRDATGSHAESCGAVVDSDVSRCASSMLRVLVFDSSSKLLLAAATVILIRVMSPIEYARYTISYAYAMVLTQLIAGSFNRVYLVGYKSLGLERQLGEFLSLQLLTIIVAAPLLLLLSPTRSIGIAAAALLLSLCLGEFARSTFQRALRFTAFSLLEFGRAVLTVLGIATIAWFLGEGLRASQVLLVQSGVSVLLFGMSMRLRLLVRLPHWQVVHAIGSDLARSQYRSLFAYFLVQAIFSQVDILVLKMTGTDHQLASYGSAYRYYTFLLLCLTAVNSVLLPLVQSFTTWAEIDEAMRRQRTALGIYGLIVLFLIAVAPALLPLVDRGKYPTAPGVFRILAFSSVVSLAFSPYVNVVMRLGQFRTLLSLVVVACPLGVGLNLCLLPMLGEKGTAISVLVSTAILNCGAYRFVQARRAASPVRLPNE